ncbi:MAG: hypothetical protein GY894_02050 [Planctomycetes bacterium]|nr:hypothetical protein [Planctomycetota bacterium]
MRLTKAKLDEAIREELRSYLKEINAFHDEDGRFTSAKKAETYSLSDRAVSDNRLDKRYAARGKMTGAYDTTDPKKSLSTPPGSSSGEKAAGRQTQKGKSIVPTYSLSQHDKKYGELREVADELSMLTPEGGFVAVPASTLDKVLQSLIPYLQGRSFSIDGPGPLQ